MEKRSPLGELFHYLQDPHLVARFQHICGVRESFSRTASAGSTTSSRTAERTHSHSNGACYDHIPGKNESKNSAFIRDGEGDNVRTTAADARKRTVFSNTVRNHGEESENHPQNGLAGSQATAGGDADGGGRNWQGANEAEEGGTGTGSQVPVPPASSTLKPLRKNSLTGDAGQEFMIDNRFLYYLFTFGTELGNELFYMTFFPFVTWNFDAFVSRRLIIVWVWVMYLGQCTKDVIGWSRPASPPVVKVEMFYNSEYSMPSTHAMSGTAIPFALFFMTYGRWEVQYIHLY